MRRPDGPADHDPRPGPTGTPAASRPGGPIIPLTREVGLIMIPSNAGGRTRGITVSAKGREACMPALSRSGRDRSGPARGPACRGERPGAGVRVVCVPRSWRSRGGRRLRWLLLRSAASPSSPQAPSRFEHLFPLFQQSGAGTLSKRLISARDRESPALRRWRGKGLPAGGSRG